MNARITIIGIEKILNLNDKSIASEWSLSNETYDRDVLMYSIINKGATFEPIYTDPDYFATMCAMWWTKHKRTFEKWFEVFDTEYEPLWDRDGYEEVHEDTHQVIDSDTTYERGQTVDETMADNATTENTVSAYDRNDYQPKDKTIFNVNRATDTALDEAGSGTNDTDDDKDFDRVAHTWGNWGISTTVQKLIEQELNIQAWDIYEHMSDIFCDEMTVRVY